MKFNSGFKGLREELVVLFYELLYMFQAVSPPIIRSTILYVQSAIVKPILLLSWMRWNSHCYCYLTL